MDKTLKKMSLTMVNDKKIAIYWKVSILNTMSYFDLGFCYCICQLNQYIYKNETEVLSNLPDPVLNSHPLSYFKT